MPPKTPPQSCPRPYILGLRAETMKRNRSRILMAARELLLKGGIAEFSIDTVARQAKVTRQTVYNQFGTRSDLLEALFDQIAEHGGMERIAVAFQQADPSATLSEYIKVFAGFWTSDRDMTRRIHGLAAVDSELGRVLSGRQARRMQGSSRIMTMLSRRYGCPPPEQIEVATKVLYALTSFEFFDALAGVDRSPEEVTPTVIKLASSFIGLGLN